MNVFSDVEAASVKEPLFEGPEDAGGGTTRVDLGTKVALVCQGCRVTTRVEAIERLGTVFVGRVVRLDQDASAPGGLAPGDFVRFRPKDVHWTE